MVGPAALAPIVAGAIEYSPYIITALSALYTLGKDVHGTHGDKFRQLYSGFRGMPKSERGRFLYNNKRTLLTTAAYLTYQLGEEGYRIYRQLRGSIGQISETKQKNPQSRRPVMAQAVIIFLALSSLTYFTLVPQKTTGHLVVPISTNVVGMVLAFIFLCVGAWLVLGKDKVT